MYVSRFICNTFLKFAIILAGYLVFENYMFYNVIVSIQNVIIFWMRNLNSFAYFESRYIKYFIFFALKSILKKYFQKKSK